MKIHAALMTQNELPDLIANLEPLANAPHIASITVVDGGSIDGTIPYMRNWARISAKIRFFIHPWSDNFPAQRNNYLARVGEIAEPGDWLLAFDPDEVLDLRAVAALPGIVAQVAARGYGRVGFRCRSVSYRGPERVWENVDDYWKGLLFAWSPSLRYIHDGEGAVHENLKGLQGPDLHLGKALGTDTFYYEHRKQENVIWPRGVRNYFIGGGGPNLGRQNHRWVELRQITDQLGIETWHQMHATLLAGHLDPRIKAWIIKYRQESGWDGASEQREWYKTYFRLYHPEEEPPELKDQHIP